MNEKQPSPKVIDIANYILKHPDKNREAVIAHFCAFLRKKRRTIEYYYKDAQEYNQSRIQKQEKAKEEVIVAEAKEEIKNAIDYRQECMKAVYRILQGGARRIDGRTISPYDSDILRAASWFADIHGWKAASKTEVNISHSASDMTREEITAEIERIKKIRDDK